jgi:hypothetical protein
MFANRISRRFTILASILCVISFGLSGPVRAQSAWQTYKGQNGSYIIEFPAPPKETEGTMKTSSGTTYAMHQYMVELGATAFIAQTSEYPSEVNVSNPRSNLEAGLKNAAKNMKDGKWANIAWVKHQNLIASDAAGEREGHVIRSYSVMKGYRIITLTYAGPLGSERSADVERFIKSLKIR